MVDTTDIKRRIEPYIRKWLRKGYGDVEFSETTVHLGSCWLTDALPVVKA